MPGKCSGSKKILLKQILGFAFDLSETSMLLRKTSAKGLQYISKSETGLITCSYSPSHKNPEAFILELTMNKSWYLI